MDNATITVYLRVNWAVKLLWPNKGLSLLQNNPLFTALSSSSWKDYSLQIHFWEPASVQFACQKNSASGQQIEDSSPNLYLTLELDLPPMKTNESFEKSKLENSSPGSGH